MYFLQNLCGIELYVKIIV